MPLPLAHRERLSRVTERSSRSPHGSRGRRSASGSSACSLASRRRRSVVVRRTPSSWSGRCAVGPLPRWPGGTGERPLGDEHGPALGIVQRAGPRDPHLGPRAWSPRLGPRLRPAARARTPAARRTAACSSGRCSSRIPRTERARGFLEGVAFSEETAVPYESSPDETDDAARSALRRRGAAVLLVVVAVGRRARQKLFDSAVHVSLLDGNLLTAREIACRVVEIERARHEVGVRPHVVASGRVGVASDERPQGCRLARARGRSSSPMSVANVCSIISRKDIAWGRWGAPPSSRPRRPTSTSARLVSSRASVAFCSSVVGMPKMPLHSGGLQSRPGRSDRCGRRRPRGPRCRS